MKRRAVMGSSMVAGLAALVAPAAASSEAASSADAAAAADDLQDVSTSIRGLQRTVEEQFATVYTSRWQGVSRVRQQQHIWMKSSQKFPDFIEIGIDVWDNIYDWHVVHQQPLSMGRGSDGRYTMLFMFTTLLLRPDQAPDYVGYAYDVDTRLRR